MNHPLFGARKVLAMLRDAAPVDMEIDGEADFQELVRIANRANDLREVYLHLATIIEDAVPESQARMTALVELSHSLNYAVMALFQGKLPFPEESLRKRLEVR